MRLAVGMLLKVWTEVTAHVNISMKKLVNVPAMKQDSTYAIQTGCMRMSIKK